MKFSNKLSKQNQINRQAFSVIVWLKEEEKMSKIASIQNEIDLNSEENLNKYESKLQDNSIWIDVQKIITIVNEFNDNGNIQGAMFQVNETIYSILFQISNRRNEIEIFEAISGLQYIVNGVNDNILYNLISENFCLLLYNIIRICIQYEFALRTLQQIVSLVTSISLRGVLMASQFDENHFYQLLTNAKLDQQLEYLIDDQLLDSQQVEEDNDIENNIRLQSAIGFCSLFDKEGIPGEEVIRPYSEIFKGELKNFSKKLQKLQSFSFNQIPDDFQDHKIYPINPSEIEIVGNIVLSMASKSQHTTSNDYEFITKRLNDLLFPILHINCGCLNNIEIQPSISVSKLISSTYFVLADMQCQVYDKNYNYFCNQNNFLEHISSIIISYAQQNTDINSHSTSLPNAINSQNKNYFTADLVDNALKFLEQLMRRIRIIMEQTVNHPELIDMIIQIASQDNDNNTNNFDQSEIIYQCLNVFKCINKFGPVEILLQLLHKSQEMALITQFICCAGSGLNDYDIITSISIQILRLIFTKIQEEVKVVNFKILDEINENLEQEGITEENDAELFHSSRREYVDINYEVLKLKGRIQRQELIENVDMNQVVIIEDDSDQDSDNN